MTFLVGALIKLGILKNDLDYHLLRASMVITFLFFGYQKWFDYEAQALLPYIGQGPLIFWMYAVLGVRGATYFLGVAEWLFGAFLFAGYWNKRLGVLGALGSCFAFIATTTIIPLGRFRRRISGDDREGCFPDEGCRPFRCVCLFTAAGRDKGFAVQDGGIRLRNHSAAGCKSDRSSRRLLVLPFIRWNERLRETWVVLS